jgi:hypothetical protein
MAVEKALARPKFAPPPRWVTLADFSDHFGWNPHRSRLISGLRLACEELRRNGCGAVYVGGSFTSSKDYPGDYDACFNPIGVAEGLDPLLFNRVYELERKERYFGDWLIGRPDDGPAGEWYRYLAFDDRSGEHHDMFGIKLRLNEVAQR